MSATTNKPDHDPAQFLKIASQGAGLSCHADLCRRSRQLNYDIALRRMAPAPVRQASCKRSVVARHLVFSKLDVTNRAQAVAQPTRMTAHA